MDSKADYRDMLAHISVLRMGYCYFTIKSSHYLPRVHAFLYSAQCRLTYRQLQLL